MAKLQQIKTLIESKQNQSALLKLKKMVAKDSQDFEAQRLIGVIYLQQNNLSLAEKYLTQSQQLKPTHQPTILNLASLYKAQKNYPQAHQCFEKLLEDSPGNASIHYNLGNLYRDQGYLEQAESAFLITLKHQPNHLAALIALGFITKNVGRIGESINYFHRALAIDPYQYKIYWALANLKQYRFSEAEQAIINQMLTQAGDKAPPELLFTKAYILEHAKQFDAAFSQLEKANQQQYRQLNRKPFDWRGFTADIKRVFSPEFIKINTATSQPRRQPIFIVSMPRSGSTLTEQILASHSDIYGAAELPYFPKIITDLGLKNKTTYPESIQSLSPDSFNQMADQYLAAVGSEFPEHIFTDKQPLNFNFVGAILMALPNAKIIHCTRLDLAVLLSCYKQLFAYGHEYSYNMQELVANYQHQVSIMAYWKDCFPDKIHTVSYEDMVTDTHQEIAQLLAFLQLDWQQSCLHFYDTKRNIKTASAGQVTQKIYTSSTQTHKKYQKSMEKLIYLLEND